MSTSRQFNTPISLSSAALTATHNSNTIGNIFTTGGNVGIGTTVPNGLLDLYSSVQSNPRIILSGQEFYQSANTSINGIALLAGVNRTNNRQLWVADSAALTPNSSNAVIRLVPTSGKGTITAIATNGTTILPLFLGGNSVVITPSGNVGIGTDSPATPLHVSNSSSNTLRLQNASSTSNACLELQNDNSTSYIGLGSSAYGGTLQNNLFLQSSKSTVFLVNGGTATAMFMNTSGNVGIGTTAPSSTLHVNGDIVSSNALILYSITPFYVEAQWTAFIESTINISSNIPSGAKAVLADVYLTNSTSDHVIITLGSEHVGNVTLWGAARGSQPSTQFTASTHTKRVNRYVIYGESDNFSSFFGLWYQSQTIYISQDRRIYWGNPGYSTGSGWLYINIKGYFL